MKRTAALLFLTLLLWASCSQRQREQHQDNETLVDSLTSVFYEEAATQPEHAMLLIDSMEAKRLLSPNVANCRRAQVAAEQFQPRVVEMYALRALKDGQLQQESGYIFYYTYILLINSASNVHNNEKALQYATTALNIATADTTKIAKAYIPDLLSLIAYCQFDLQQNKAANTNVERAYAAYEETLEGARSFSWFYPQFQLASDAVINNIADDIGTAMRWLPRLDSCYVRTTTADDIPPHVKDECQALMEIAKARAYSRAGQQQEAHQHYEAFLATDYGRSDMGQKTAIPYLETAGLWREMQHALAAKDSFMTANHATASLDYLSSTLSPLIKVQTRLGNKDQALATANRLIDLLDSAEQHVALDQAAELAVIYETQEKETVIAEQRATLSHQRTVTVVAALLLLLLFLTIFMIHRHRAAKRLEEKNRELEQKNEELTIANERAEESSKMKTNFIQQISHEIRTPLNILSGFTQIVTTPGMKLSDEQKADINQRITENTDRITSLVNKMLELSEANSQSVIERTDRVTPAQIAAQAAEEAHTAQATHISFSMQVLPEAESATLSTSQRYAVRALTLLLDNAQKFTKQGTVTLTVGASSFTIQDTGIGIPTEEAEHIFEEFVQLDEYYDGTGIGLTVARSIARRLGGDIVFDTGYTGGARFVMTLPLEQSSTHHTQ